MAQVALSVPSNVFCSQILGEAEYKRLQVSEPEGRVLKAPGESLRFIKNICEKGLRHFVNPKIDYFSYLCTHKIDLPENCTIFHEFFAFSGTKIDSRFFLKSAALQKQTR